MESPRQLQWKAQQRTQAKKSVTGGPFIGHCNAVNFRNEKMNVVTPLQTRQVPFQQPFVGRSSWIRCTPEPGIKPILQYRSDRFQPIVVKYEEETTEDRIRHYLNGRSVYRPLRPGEIETSSKGLAQSYWAERPVQENRGGIIRDWKNQDELEYGQKAPVHRKLFIDNVSGEIKDEAREGVVKRYKSPHRTFFPKVDDNYGKELLVNLRSFDETLPTLLDKREGNVFDDEGELVLHTTTARPLRLLNTWYTEGGGSYVEELDEVGNFEQRFPDTATEGHIVKLPGGGVKYTIEEDFKIQGSNKTSVKMLLGKDLLVDVGRRIYLGSSSADEPLVLGHVLRQFLTDVIDAFLNAPQLGITAVGPSILDPSIRAQLNLFKRQYLNTASTNILSQVSFTQRRV